MPTKVFLEATQVWSARVAAADRRRGSPPRQPPPVPDHTMLKCISTEGAFGDVWLARSVMGADRAVKVVYRDRFDDDFPYNTEFEGLSRFHDLSREHPGFVDILHVSRNDQAGYFFYVMELADNLKGAAEPRSGLEYMPSTLTSLREIHPGGRLPARECIQRALELTEALIELHRHKLVHRDIKPSNVLLVKGRAKLGDIGLVAEITNEFLPIVGTPGYMDEELHGTARGDLFSLGKVIYVIATGRTHSDWPAWPADPQMPEAEVEGLRVLDEIFVKACAQDRSRRYQTAEEIHADLLRAQARLNISSFARFERYVGALRRYGVAAGIILVLLSLALWQWNVQRHQAGELLLRQVGAAVANGNRAVEAGDLAGALPWFSEALRLDEENSERARAHRLRMGSTFQQAPALVQMWFRSPRLNYAEFGGDSTQLLASDTNHHWNLWNLSTGRETGAAFGTGALEERAHLSPRGDQAVTVALDAPTQIWNPRTGAVQFKLATGKYTYCAAFSPDGERLVTTGAGGAVTFWDARTGARIRNLEGHATNTYVMHAAFSHDGRRLVTVAWDSRAILWDLASPEPASRPLVGHTKPIYHAAFSPDDRTVATASLDWTVRLWDVASGQIKGVPLSHGDGVRGVGFSPDGAWLVSAGWDFAAHVWEVASGQRRMRLPHNRKVMYAAFSPDGRHVLTVAYDGVVRIWDPKLQPLAPAYQPLVVSADGSTLLRFRTNDVAWLDAGTGGALGLLARSGGSPTNTFLSPDGTGLVTLDRANTTQQVVRVWHRGSIPDASPPLNVDRSFKVSAVDSSGRHLALIAATQAVVLDLTQSREILRLTAPSHTVIRSAALSMDGQRLALAAGNTLQIWNIADGPEPKVHLNLKMEIERIVFDRNGRFLLAACSDTSLNPGWAEVRDAVTGDLVGMPLRHRDGVCDAAFRHDGLRILTCSEDGNAMLWETGSGRNTTQPLRHPWHVKCGAFSPDGGWVATGCRDKTIRLWDAATGEALTPPLRQPEVPVRIQFAGPQRLVVQGESGGTWLVDLPLDWRPSADLRDLAQLLSAQPAYSAADPANDGPGDLEHLWKRLRERRPQEFPVLSP